MNKSPLVSVIMITYNHGQYINQAIEGVLMQECDFEIELIIANDCSQDNTEELVNHLIDNHPRSTWIKYFRHTSNKGMIPNFVFALNEAKGRYIAICEGDDYWVDNQKLKKQIDILETNQSFGLCSTNSFILDSSDKNISQISSSLISREIDFQELLVKSNPIFTLTIVFRKDLILDFPFEEFSNFSMLDLPLWLYILSNSRGYLLSDTTAVYRKLQESASHSNSLAKNLKFERDTFLTKEYFINKKLGGNKKYIYEVSTIYIYKNIAINVRYSGSWSDFIEQCRILIKMNVRYIFKVFYQLINKIIRFI
jgi:glycosyltransferase involved in cell wall biosynthesis